MYKKAASNWSVGQTKEKRAVVQGDWTQGCDFSKVNAMKRLPLLAVLCGANLEKSLRLWVDGFGFEMDTDWPKCLN